MRHLFAPILILMLILVAPLAVAGERIARQGDDEVDVFDTPCVSMETIARIPQAQREGWNKAQGFFRGERFFGCWRPMGDAVYILWEDGDQGVVPLQELKPALEV